MLNTDTIQITPELLTLIAEIDEFKGAWRALGTLAPERLNALRRVATIESIGSSTRIEGSKLTDREVEHLLAALEIKSFANRDEQEVAGYAEVMETVFQAWQDISITENHIKQLHRDLLRYSTKDERHRGEYKTLSNSVAAFDEQGRQIGIVFETASPFNTPARMTELVTWLREARELGRMHPLLLIAVFVVVFLEIHPFQDGNGRLSRVLTMRHGPANVARLGTSLQAAAQPSDLLEHIRYFARVVVRPQARGRGQGLGGRELTMQLRHARDNLVQSAVDQLRRGALGDRIHQAIGFVVHHDGARGGLSASADGRRLIRVLVSRV